MPNRKRDKTDIERLRSGPMFQSLFEALPGLFLVLLPNLKIVAASDAYLQATYTRREDIVGRKFGEAFPPNPRDPTGTASILRASLDRVHQSGISDSPGIQKYDVRRPDGSFEVRYWSIINAPIKDPTGKIAYVVHRIENVTDYVQQKRAAAQPHAPAAYMEAEVFQTTQRVQDANRQLAAANAELAAFSYSISHDLRAPLRHIQGYAEMLVNATAGTLPDAAQRCVDTIVAASIEMGRMIDGLIAYSRAGREELQQSVVDLDALVRAVIADQEMAAQGRNIGWSISPLPAVRGDASALRQVFANLIGNAVKYTRLRDRAEIEVGQDGEEHGRKIYFVRDNGVGFDMNHADNLFGVFRRLHRADEFEGTGIGLAIVQRVINRHGGRIWPDAAVGRGATFYFTLPPRDQG